MTVVDWSLGGIAIGPTFGIELPEDINSITDFQLDITLEQVTVSLKASARLIYVQPDRRGYEFIGLSLDQERVLRSYIMSHGEMLLEMPPANPKITDKTYKKSRSTTQRGLGRANTVAKYVLAAASIAAVAFLGLSVHEILPSPTQSRFAAVAAPATNMISPEHGFIARGLVDSGESVAVGDPLFEILRHGDLSSILRIQSPCDCVIAAVLAQRGDEVLAGQTLAILATDEDVSAKLVEAVFWKDVELEEGDEVEVLVQGMDTWLSGVVRSQGLAVPSDIQGLPEVLESDTRYNLFLIDLVDNNIDLGLLTPATVRAIKTPSKTLGLAWPVSLDWLRL